MTNITPSHLPKGTVFKTLSKSEFIVDHIKAMHNTTGCIYVVVATIHNLQDAYYNNSYFKIPIDNIIEIISIGKKMDIRYWEFDFYNLIKNYNRKACNHNLIETILSMALEKLQPNNQFRTTEAVCDALLAGVFIGNPQDKFDSDITNLELTTLEKFYTFKINKKKLKKWVKQNVNRYIVTKAEIRKREDEDYEEFKAENPYGENTRRMYEYYKKISPLLSQ